MLNSEHAELCKIKAARGVKMRAQVYASKKNAVIAFCGSFPDFTVIGIELTGKVHPYKAGFLAPLTIDEAHFTEAMDILDASITAARAA